MSFTSPFAHARALLPALVLIGAVPLACAQNPSSVRSMTGVDQKLVGIEGLGAISFPNSGSASAQESFYRGVLLLHSFEYGSAADAFREAQLMDPDFAMAYWGEAMTYNHSLWAQHDGEAGKEVLERLAPSPDARRAKAGSEREKRFMDAVEILYGHDGSKTERDDAYMQAMRSLHEAYPDDDEATAFYALSILGTKNGARDFATYMRAAALVLPVFERNPNHPGAAHYIIHSFDDPIHAPLGLPAARAYSEIAPGAAHAQHMTSHIFVALGMWDETVAANIRASDVQDTENEKNGGRPNVCGHYSSWLQYGYLQLGETTKAEELMDRCYERVKGEARYGEWAYFTSMRARQVVDTQDWTAAERWSVDVDRVPDDEEVVGYGSPRQRYQITDALAELQLGDDSKAKALVASRRPVSPGMAFQINDLAGLIAIHNGQRDKGIELLKQAAAAEDALPLEYGPPEPIQPAHEVLGAALLKLGRNAEAADAFGRALERTPRRAVAATGLRRSGPAGGTGETR